MEPVCADGVKMGVGGGGVKQTSQMNVIIYICQREQCHNVFVKPCRFFLLTRCGRAVVHRIYVGGEIIEN